MVLQRSPHLVVAVGGQVVAGTVQEPHLVELHNRERAVVMVGGMMRRTSTIVSGFQPVSFKQPCEVGTSHFRNHVAALGVFKHSSSMRLCPTFGIVLVREQEIPTVALD
jgi:hypothetical protein